MTSQPAGLPDSRPRPRHVAATESSRSRTRDSARANRFTRLNATLLGGTRTELAADLAAIEEDLAHICADPEVRVEDAARHVLLRGGKRVRPLLTCAVLRALGGDPSPHFAVLTAVELAHAGSLLHDDIIDGAQVRRGCPAAHVLFDVPTAILAGDVLLTVAFERVVDAPSELRRSFTTAVRDVCRGEALERERLFDPATDLAHALLVNRLKTAALFRYAAEAGAILAGADSEVVSAARDYGSALGEAFQLADDLLDFCGDPTAIGKPIGMDLVSGCITAPMAIALDRDPTLRDKILEVWDSENGDGERVLAGLHLPMVRADAFAATRELATEYAEAARAAAYRLTDGRWQDQLAVFAGEVAEYANPTRRASS